MNRSEINLNRTETNESNIDMSKSVSTNLEIRAKYFGKQRALRLKLNLINELFKSRVFEEHQSALERCKFNDENFITDLEELEATMDEMLDKIQLIEF